VAIAFNFTFGLNWEKTLCCNSMGILASYRCASADAFWDMIEFLGMNPIKYFVGDQLIHTFPAIYMYWYCAFRHKKMINPQHGAFAFIGQLFFAYSQVGKLDV